MPTQPTWQAGDEEPQRPRTSSQSADSRTERPVFSCRRWYRLTGKSAKPDELLSPVVVSSAALQCAVSAVPTRPQSNWSSTSTVDSTKSRHALASVATRPAFVGRYDQRPATERYNGVYCTVATLSPSKWTTGNHFTPQNRKRLVNKAYAKTDPTAKGRRELERQALKDHIYLPALHKTRKLFQSPRNDDALGDDSSDAEQGRRVSGMQARRSTEPARPTPRPPVGASLLSSQIESLQEKLHRHIRSTSPSAATTNRVLTTSSAALWCSQPPRPTASRSYRSARYSLPQSDSISSSEASEMRTTSTSDCSASHLLILAGTAPRSDVDNSDLELIAPSEDGSLPSSLESHVLRLLERSENSVLSLSSSSDYVQASGSIYSVNDDDEDELALLQGFEDVVFVNDRRVEADEGSAKGLETLESSSGCQASASSSDVSASRDSPSDCVELFE